MMSGQGFGRVQSAQIEVASQYLYRGKQESQGKNLHKTGNVLTEILTGDLPNKGLKIHFFCITYYTPSCVCLSCVCVVIFCVFVVLCVHCCCFFLLQMPDCWLEVSIRKVLRSATSTQVLLGFRVSKNKC